MSEEIKKKKEVYFDHEANSRNTKKKERYIKNKEKMLMILYDNLNGLIPTGMTKGKYQFGRVDCGWYVISDYALEKLEIVKHHGKVRKQQIAGDKDTYRDMWFPEKDTLNYTEDGYIKL